MLTVCLLIALIHLPNFHVFSLQNGPTFISYIDKTNSLCYTNAVSNILDLQTHLQVFFLCISAYWERCLVMQNTPMLTAGKFNFLFPCFHGKFMLGTANLTLNIKVHMSFQIELRFTEFSLPRGFTGCVTNKIEVRTLFSNMYSRTSLKGYLDIKDNLNNQARVHAL